MIIGPKKRALLSKCYFALGTTIFFLFSNFPLQFTPNMLKHINFKRDIFFTNIYIIYTLHLHPHSLYYINTRTKAQNSLYPPLMASIIFFTLFTLTLASTIHAREAQFFNKFSNNIPQESQPLNTNQQQPEFIPQTQDSAAYGLYGHGSGQLPPSATATLPENLPENYNPVAYTTPIHSSTQYVPEEFKDPQAYMYHGQSRTYNSQMQEGGRYYGEGSGYNSQKRGFDDARFVEREDGGNMYNSEMQVENGRYNSEKQGMSNTRYGTSNNANMYNSEKQGMSDTRFLENGKYYYDVNMENINSNANANMNTRRYNNWRNEYKTQGYYGNNENSYDRYNTNTNTNYNGGGYEGQEDQFNP